MPGRPLGEANAMDPRTPFDAIAFDIWPIVSRTGLAVGGPNQDQYRPPVDPCFRVNIRGGWHNYQLAGGIRISSTSAM